MRTVRQWLSACVVAGTLAFVMPTFVAAQAKPKNATAQCKDGTYSTAKTERGACSQHGGVQTWFGDSDTKSAAKDDAKAAGKATKEAAKDTGKAAKSAGKATENATKEAGKATKEGAQTAANAVKPKPFGPVVSPPTVRSPPSGRACGEERWAVKTLADPDATRVDFLNVTADDDRGSERVAATLFEPAGCTHVRRGVSRLSSDRCRDRRAS
jgi:Protein of unknown function (DUF3761)